MDDTKIIKDQPIPENDRSIDHLQGKILPKIALLNQNGNLLKLNRSDTFRLVIYFYSLTGHPKKKLPKFIELNSLPIGISTQNVDDIKEMTVRLGIQYDVLSDFNLECVNQLSLPTFSINNDIFIKRLTIVVEKNIIVKVFFPIFSINKHVNDVLLWLKEN